MCFQTGSVERVRRTVRLEVKHVQVTFYHQSSAREDGDFHVVPEERGMASGKPKFSEQFMTARKKYKMVMVGGRPSTRDFPQNSCQ